jgi:membrane-associated protein
MQSICTILLSFEWKELINPNFYVSLPASLWIIAFIIFAETGLLIGFFLPGDSLLFAAGIYSEDLIRSSAFYTDSPAFNLLELILIIFVAGVIGNSVGYWIGHKSGPLLFHKKDTWYFKQKHLRQAHEFFEKRGGAAIIFARFLPIVRTFAPIVAGIVDMKKKRFTLYNIIGSFGWVALMVGGGHYLDKFISKKYHFELREHIDMIVILLCIITCLPLVYKVAFGKKQSVKG